MNKPVPPAAGQTRADAAIKPAPYEAVRLTATDAAPGSDAIIAKWKKHIGSARIVWSKLSNEELLLSQGQAEKLIGLVQERYALTGKEAGRRVRNFLQQYKLPDA
jgi:uncharacterized protein YjbJ (UPF0337 family)